MSRIDDLKVKRAVIESEIEAEKRAVRKANKERASGKYVRVVCHECKGDGDEHDHRSPAILGPCCGCNGLGFVWRAVWLGKKSYEMRHEGKEGEYPKRK